MTLHESFRAAYGLWRGDGLRGDALLSFAHELAKLPEFGHNAPDRQASVPEANALVAAVLMLDEAWRRDYAASEVTEDALEEMLSATRLRLGRPAPVSEPQPPLKNRLSNRRAELERVRLTRPVRAFYDPKEMGFSTNKEIPAGAIGTVVAVIGEGQAYDVEFTKPFAAIATVHDADLT